MRIETSNKTYIHYGSSHFDPERFVPIHNELYRNKPKGGLWASPLNDEGYEDGFGWRTFWADDISVEEDETDNVEFLPGGRYGTSFRFTLKPESKVLKLIHKSDMEGIPCVPDPVDHPCFRVKIPDFEYLLCGMGVAAIEFSPEELYDDMYGWDVECVLVLDPYAVVEVKE